MTTGFVRATPSMMPIAASAPMERTIAFATATEWVARLLDAQRLGQLAEELRRLGRVPLVIVDEVGYVPFDPAAHPDVPPRLEPL
jgi:DNA replication protein DnaC